MAEYKPRAGVVAAQICGTFVLIPTRAVYDVCKTIQPIPAPWVMLWMMLERGESTDRICAYYQRISRSPEAELRGKIETVLASLCEKGYLVKEGSTTL